MVTYRQGEEGLWSDHSAALLPIDGLAGVGQALHLADGFADRTGSVDANAIFGGFHEPRCIAMGSRSVQIVPHCQVDRSVSEIGEFDTPSLQPTHSSGLLEINSDEVQRSANAASSQSPAHTSDSEGPFRCTVCNESKRRPCELKYVGTSSSRYQSVAPRVS